MNVLINLESPNDANAWNDKGKDHTELGKYDETIICFDKALEINQKYAYAWNGKGKDHTELGKGEDAKECFDKAKQI